MAWIAAIFFVGLLVVALVLKKKQQN